MRKILLILLAFLSVGIFAQNQGTLERDIVKVNDELFVRDSTLLQIIESNTSIPSLDSTWQVITTGEVQAILNSDTKIDLNNTDLTIEVDNVNRIIFIANSHSVSDGINSVNYYNSSYLAGAFGNTVIQTGYDSTLFSGSPRIKQGISYTPTTDRDLITKAYGDANYIGGGGFTQPVDSITLAVQDPSYFAGKVIYDTTSEALGALTFYNEELDVAANIPYELWVPTVYNNSGSTISNGDIVYIDTIFGGMPTIELADQSTFEKSRIIGVATHDIENGTEGIVTNFGLVRDVNLTGCVPGQPLYLASNGNVTTVEPSGGNYRTRIGFAIECDADGIMMVYISTSEYTDEIIKAFGYPSFMDSYTTVSFNNSNRYFKIAPTTGSDFYYYQNGVKYITEEDSVQITDVEGLHAIYYDTTSLSSLANPTAGNVDNLIRNKTLTAYVYWDTTNNRQIYLGNERHTFHFDSWVHAWAHFSFGAQYFNGIGLTGIVTDGSGNVDTTAQFGIGSGTIADEDVVTFTPTIPKGDTLGIYYLDGTDLNLRRTRQPGFPVLTDITVGIGSTGRLVYNDVTTGTFSVIANNDFVLCHIFANNSIDDSCKIVAVVGQNDYPTLGSARTGALTEITELVSGELPFEEFVPVATVIYQTSNGYANAVRARIRSTDEGDDYIDWRQQTISSSGGSSGGFGNFVDLGDTPNTYVGEAGKIVAVNSSENALEFIDMTSASADSSFKKAFINEIAGLDSNAVKIEKLYVDTIILGNTINLVTDTTNNTFNDTIDFSLFTTNYPPYQITTDDTIRVKDDGGLGGYGAEVTFYGDGSSNPVFSEFTPAPGTLTYDSTLDVANVTTFYKVIGTPSRYYYNIWDQYDADFTAPLLLSNVIENSTPTQIFLNYNETLDNTSIPDSSDFDISPDTVVTVAVANDRVTLTSTKTYLSTDTVVVSYTVGSNPIRDESLNNALAFSNDTSTNNVGGFDPLNLNPDYYDATNRVGDGATFYDTQSEFDSVFQGDTNSWDIYFAVTFSDGQPASLECPFGVSNSSTSNGRVNFYLTTAGTMQIQVRDASLNRNVANTDGAIYSDGATSKLVWNIRNNAGTLEAYTYNGTSTTQHTFTVTDISAFTGVTNTINAYILARNNGGTADTYMDGTIYNFFARSEYNNGLVKGQDRTDLFDYLYNE